MVGPGSVRIAFETARLQLAAIHSDGAEARCSAYQIACKLSATTLGVERVSVWRLKDDDGVLDCAVRYSRSRDQFERGGTLRRTDCSRYFAAMLSRRVISAEDAVHDPKTAELATYLRAEGIGALLDAPIYRDGAVIGIVCHEHCGGTRRWTENEATFASAVADMLTILVEQAELAELRAALEQERHAQARTDKMVALQRLGRVLAHDLNNVLMVAMSRNEVLPSTGDASESSREIGEVLAYGARLVQQLADFCQERRGEPGVDLTQLLHSLEPALRALVGARIQLTLALPPRGFVVPVPALEAEQLVLNLCMNAADAINGEGKLRVALTFDPVREQVALEVADSGEGMDEATQARIFEPYFSTKASHSGVGLMAVYGIVQRAGGSIALQSERGAGTTFRISLPPLPIANEHAAGSRTDRGDADPPWAF